MARRIDADTLALIKQWEGLRLTGYADIGGVWTIGYGHTRTARAGMTISEAEAERLLREDLARFETAVAAAVTVPLTEPQFGALVSWAFNVGVTAMQDSTLVRKLNGGDYEAVPAELIRWNKVKGVTVAGLVNRRAAEVGLWSRGSFVSSNTVEPTAAPSATANTVKATAATAAVGIALQPILDAVIQAVPALVSLQSLSPWIAGAVVLGVAMHFIAARFQRV
jgi:GH24 family phage-related lysozyme (muramidase)